MSEVHKISGQGPAAPEPRKHVETDKFKKEMEKVGETDTEQRKKGKHKEHTRAEKAAEAETKEPTKEDLLVKEVQLPTGTGSYKVESATQAAASASEKIGGLQAPSHVKKHEPVQPSAGEPPENSFEEVSFPGLTPAPETVRQEPPSQKRETPLVETPTFEPKKTTAKVEPQVNQASIQGPQTLPPASTGPMLSLPQAPNPNILQLPPALANMFDRMVGVMTIMQSSDVRETTIHLTNDKMKGTVFFGAQIVITEHKSAPREFNIQFVGTPQATEAFQAKIPVIYHSFQTGFDFKVHRLEVAINRDEKVKKVMDAGKEREEQGSS